MKKPMRQTDFRENAGKVLIDLGKLIFGSIFLAGVLRGEVPQAIMVAGGFLAAASFCAVGLWWVSKGRRK